MCQKVKEFESVNCEIARFHSVFSFFSVAPPELYVDLDFSSFKQVRACEPEERNLM
jgi:hypothetical protein